MLSSGHAGALRRRVLLSSTMLVAAVAGYGRRAYGACVFTGGSSYVCSGANVTTQNITGPNANNASVSTVAGFSVNTPAGNAITITGDGAVSYTDTNASPLTAPAPGGDALAVRSIGDDVGTSTPGSVTINTNGTLSGRTDGIYARNYGTGALTITANGNVTGTNGRGIYAQNSAAGTDLTVTTGAGTTVTGRTYGIRARNLGTGALTITANGNVTGTGAGNDGIRARNYGTDLSVTTAAGTTVRGYNRGIYASTPGALTITANGDVISTGAGSVGILALNSAAASISVTTAAGTTVRGRIGIAAINYGAGGTQTITVNGNVTGTSNDGIYAGSNGGGAIAITVGATGTVTSANAFAIETVTGPATVTVAGTVAGSMRIGGAGSTLTFQPGAVYKVFVNPAAASLATVNGTASLAGTVNASFQAGSYVTKTWTILTSAGLGGTKFTGVSSPNFATSLSYNLADTDVSLTLNAATLGAGTPLSQNQQNVANAINSYFNNGGALPPGFATVFGLTGGALTNALSQLSGQPGASTAQAGLTGMGQFINGVFDAAFGDGPGQGGATGFAEENAYAAKPKVSREAKDAYAAVTPRDRAPAFDARWAVWASIYGGNNRVNGDSTAGTNTTTSRIFGTAVGATYRFTPDTQAGFALGGAGSSFDIAGGFGGGKADVFNAAAYAKHNWGAAYVAGLLGYSWQDTTTDRTVTISGTDRLHASFNAQALAARLEGGWRYATPVVGVTPYAAAQTTSFYLPGYGETATSGSNTFALNDASKTVTATRGELGAKFDKAMLVQGGIFTLKAKTAWAHDWNTDRTATATFQTLPGATFVVNGAQPSANAALASLDAEMKWHNGWTLAASFDSEFSRTTTGYAGKGSVKYAW